MDTRRTRVFISYSRKDQRLFQQFRTMLAPAIRARALDVWDDTMITPGTMWRTEIETAIQSARVAVLLVSQHFLSSDFISKHELPPLLAAAREEGVTVFWILLSHCLYEATEIAKYQAAHDIATPLDCLRRPERNAVLRNLCAQLGDIATQPESGTPVSTAENWNVRGTPSNTRLPVTQRWQPPLPSIDESSVDFHRTPQTIWEPRQGSAAELAALFAEGFQAILVLGDVNTGKSELVSGFTRINTIVRGRAQLPLRRPSPVGATNPGEVWYQVIAGKEQRVFVDPSGEFFRSLSARERRCLNRSDIKLTDFAFLHRAVLHLAGVIFVFDLTREDRWRAQEDEFLFILSALRWLRFDTDWREGKMGVSATIATRVDRLPRLDLPLWVAFTKADLLSTLADERPITFAKARLPVLHGAINTHVSRYHYDFCHTMIHTDTGDDPLERPVGVLLSIEWLLRPVCGWMPRILR